MIGGGAAAAWALWAAYLLLLAIIKLVLTMLHGPLFGVRAHAPRDATSLLSHFPPETSATAGRAERVRARQRAARAAARAIAPAARGAEKTG